MGAAEKQRLEIKIPDPFFIMADIAVFLAHLPRNVIWIFRLDMKASRTMADFTPGIFEARGFFFGNKPARFPEPGCVTLETPLIFLFGQLFFHFFNTLERMGLFRVLHVVGILGFMAVPAGFGTDV